MTRALLVWPSGFVHKWTVRDHWNCGDNFTCQLARPQYLNIGANIILDVSRKALLDEMKM